MTLSPPKGLLSQGTASHSFNRLVLTAAPGLITRVFLGAVIFGNRPSSGTWPSGASEALDRFGTERVAYLQGNIFWALALDETRLLQRGITGYLPGEGAGQ